jgi:hypothetical protein
MLDSSRVRETPTLMAYPVTIGESQSLAVWCPHCQELHIHPHHGGYHEAGCKKLTPYTATGYNLLISASQVQAEELYEVASSHGSD